jgi:hypothetical protein
LQPVARAKVPLSAAAALDVQRAAIDRWTLASQQSNFRLLGHFKGIINFNAKIANGAL